MRILAVDSYDPADPDRWVADAAVDHLESSGHDVHRVDLVAEGFAPAMSAAERAAYHDDGANVLADEVQRSVDGVRNAEAMLFCYPTTTFTVPAVLKAWLERVLVPGVAFGFDDKGRVAPGMTNIRRLGVITTTPHGRWATAGARNGGKRTLLWTLRLSCARTCRRTYVALPTGPPPGDPDATAAITKKLSRWRSP